MADTGDDIFNNLPRRRKRAVEDDDARSFFRERRGVYVPEGPLPPRPHASGKGGPSLTTSNAPPVLSASPTIAGSPAVGQTLSCSQGVWFNSPTSYTYQWLRDGTVISGATSSTYVVVSGDLGHSISCTVTATNAFGSTPATSNAVLIAALPVNTAAPVISGSLTVGSTLSCTQGTWSNSPTSYAYQWQRGGTNISGATSSTYVTVTADGGTSVGCLVTATNASGSASQASNTLAIASGSGHSAQALAYLARTVGGNEGGNGTNIANLIDGLVSDGVWAKLDCLYVLAQQNETDAKLNLIGTSYGLTQVGSLERPGPRSGSLVFAAYAGFSGFNTLNSYLDTGLNPFTATSLNFVQNSASFGVWLYSIPDASTNVVIGTGNVGTAGENNIYPDFTGNFFARVNFSTSPGVTSPGASGLYVGDRPSSASSSPYYNGAALVTQPGTSVAPQSHNFQIGEISGAGTDATLSAAFIGASLGSAGQLALYNRLQTYMSAISQATSVWSAADATANGMTLSNGGLTVTNPAAATYATVRGTISRTSGKYYVEFLASIGTTVASSDDVMFGLADASFVPASGNYLGHVTYSAGWDNEGGSMFVSSGFNGIIGLTPVRPIPANDVFAIAVDLTAGQIWLAHNNVWSGGGNPATGANPSGSIVSPALGLALFPGFTVQGVNGGTWTLQPTAASQTYAPPAGFTPWG